MGFGIHGRIGIVRYSLDSQIDCIQLRVGLRRHSVMGAVLFYFLCSVRPICAELASTYPRDGGLFEWVKEAYGEKFGFLVSWLNWTSKIFWYTSFLTFLTINVSFAINMPELSENKTFVLIMSLAVFWILSFISTKGMTFGKIFTNLGALGSTVPAVLLILMAFGAAIFFDRPSASVYTVETMTPVLNWDSLGAISSVMFAFAGSELTANFVTEMENPKRDFPRAIFIAAAVVAGIYMLGSVAITMIMPTDQITASQGILVSLAAISAWFGIGSWFIQLVALGITFSMVGAIILYIASPVKMLFGSVKNGIFPESMTRTNSRNIPERAVYLQAILVTVIILAFQFIPSVDAIYNVLVTMTALTALFPYVLLFMSYIKLRKTRPDEERPYEISKNTGTAVSVATLVLIVTVIGIICSAAPVMPTWEDNLIYEAEMIFGAVVVIGAGLGLWSRFVKKTGFKE
ncbi:APC family permease [Anaeroglobus geminatus]|uniref:Amino acid permease n=1 Tax=Anaeroglobus geminatus F0357 TaxID=861450 RepID=G9YGF5_9FIRM|nr:APC family permease [Anaeroglobus geminatus]EHM42177.1 amino acid permease [Anaeroglobus geminatus F0357]